MKYIHIIDTVDFNKEDFLSFLMMMVSGVVAKVLVVFFSKRC